MIVIIHPLVSLLISELGKTCALGKLNPRLNRYLANRFFQTPDFHLAVLFPVDFVIWFDRRRTFLFASYAREIYPFCALTNLYKFEIVKQSMIEGKKLNHPENPLRALVVPSTNNIL